jgi:hypothetical protein
MKPIRLIALMGLVLIMGAAQARAEKPYGLAGCGLGNLWMGKNHQVFAATTNDAFYIQFFGISSGTSNCAETSDHAANMRIYVQANKVALADDIARGNGETIVNLAQLAGCKDGGAFAMTLQKNYSRIFPTQNVEATDVSQSIITTIHSDAGLAATCKFTI